MAAKSSNSLSVLVLAPPESNLHNIASAFDDEELEFSCVPAVDNLPALIHQIDGLFALVLHADLFNPENIKIIQGVLDETFIEAGGPVIFVGQSFDRRKILMESGTLRISRFVDERNGPDAMYGALKAEVEEFRMRLSVRKAVESGRFAIGEIENATFRFRTREEAKNIATMLASACAEPVSAAIGLTELFVNAVEHGCLMIGHGEKGRLIEAGRLQNEIKYRRTLPEYSNRYASVEFQRLDNKIKFYVIDPGEGFDYQAFTEEEDGHTKKHGRGITMAGGCFDEISYFGKGNEVVAICKIAA